MDISADKLMAGAFGFGDPGSQRRSQGSADRPRKPASCPGQTELSVLKMCCGKRTAAGSAPDPCVKCCTTAPSVGQSFGAPGLAFSTFVG